MPCARNLSVEAGAKAEPLPPASLQLLLLPRGTTTSIAFDVRACSDVHVILYVTVDSGTGRPPPPPLPPRADVIDIVIGAENNTASAIQNCTDMTCQVVNRTQPHSPLHCSQFRRFSVSWRENVEVLSFDDENGTWQSFLRTSTPRWGSVQVYSIFVAYMYDEEDTTTNKTTSEWRIGEFYSFFFF